VGGSTITAAGRPTGCSAGLGLAAGLGCGALTVLLAGGAGLLIIRTGLSDGSLALLPFTVSCGILGGLLIAVRPRNPVSWGFALTGLLFAVGMLAEQYAAYGLFIRPGSLPGTGLALWLQSWVYQTALVIFVFVPLYFPDGRLPAVRWRWISRSALALMVATALLAATAPADIRLGNSALANPYGIDELRPLGWLTQWGLPLIWLGLFIAAVGSLVLRFRRAEGETRQQIKWLAYALVLVAVACVRTAA
jgi:hypothetical protein